MKNTLIAAIAGIGLMAGSAMAQPALRAKVPFTFHVGDTTLPAGTYEIALLKDRVMRICGSSSAKVEVVFFPIPVMKRESSAQPSKVVFVRYGADYFLTEVWEPEAPTGRALTKSNLEIELARKLTPVRIEAVTASNE